MRPHDWVVLLDPETAATDADADEGFPYSKVWPKDADLDLSKVTWARCRGCGSLVTTDRGHFPDRCHEGWGMPADCDETVVLLIMEE